jgi:predicted O-methyltransferase YrrM
MFYRYLRSRVASFINPARTGNRSWRPQWLPTLLPLRSEDYHHSHIPIEKAELFLSYNGGSTEMEVLNWLYSTVLLLKPKVILETGAADGLGTIALASACKANGFGMVHSIELDKPTCDLAIKRLHKAGLDKFATYHCTDSFSFIKSTELVFDFAFYDSLCEIRAAECEMCVRKEILKGLAVFHDTSPYRTESLIEWPSPELHNRYRQDLHRISEQYFGNRIFETQLSRGLTVLFPPVWPVIEK